MVVSEYLTAQESVNVACCIDRFEDSVGALYKESIYHSLCPFTKRVTGKVGVQYPDWEELLVE